MSVIRQSSCLRALCGFAMVAAALELAAADREPTTHTLIATECRQYFTWQTIGIVYTLRKAGMPGPVTRLVSCTDDEWDKFPDEDKAIDVELGILTHVAPSYSVHPRTGDVYPGINKPVAVIDWMAHTDVAEDYVLVIDADMIMRRPVLPQELGAKPGTAISGFFGYMVGVVNELALRHVPEVEPRQDTLAGPKGRRGDQVGGFTLIEREDLRRVGPFWLQISEDVRFDPKAWNLTGDHYAREGERPWIAEMYGYSFGCSRAGVWHHVHPTAMLYPGYEVGLEHFREPVRLLHYGILWTVAGTDYTFDKHWHYDFQALACPPWHVASSPRESKRGLFAHPPRPSSLNTTGAERLRDLLAIEVTARLNEAFCDRHRRHCPASAVLEHECGTADEIAREVDEVYASLEIPPDLLEMAVRPSYPRQQRDVVAEAVAQHPERSKPEESETEEPGWRHELLEAPEERVAEDEEEAEVTGVKQLEAAEDDVRLQEALQGLLQEALEGLTAGALEDGSMLDDAGLAQQGWTDDKLQQTQQNTADEATVDGGVEEEWEEKEEHTEL